MPANTTDFTIRLLGPPALTVDRHPVDFPTRKTAALLFFLAANGTRPVDRQRLAGLFWGSSESEAARVSLRKALSLLSTTPAGNLVGKDRSSVWFAGDPARCDLAQFNRCLLAGTEHAFRDALTHWHGLPLEGLEVGEPVFDEWVETFRAEVVGTAHRALAKRLAALPPTAGNAGLETAVCELIVRIEPSDGEANERLIRRLAGQGDKAGAARQVRAFRAALAALDLPLPRAVQTIVRDLRDAPDTSPAEPPADLSDGEHGRPRVLLMQPDGLRHGPDLFSFTHSEVLCQLSRFRSMRTYERSDSAPPGATLVSRIRLSDAIDHDYRLLLWDEPGAKALYLRCLNVRSQHTVSCTRMPYEQLSGRQEGERTIAAAINAIEQDILADDAGRPDTPFARWLDAFRQLQQFTPRADQIALGLLEGLAADRKGQRLSLVHSSISSILMKRRLFKPASERMDRDAERARAAAHHALVLDAMEPFNHVIHGWLRIQSGDHERALVAFDDALALNPTSSRTLIAAAEANAHCGNHDVARTLADRAMSYSGRYVPPYFHAYLANIAYLAGDPDGCVRALQRAPENVETAILAVAAHQERGDPAEAAAARTRFERELRRSEPHKSVDGQALSRWLVTSNMTRDPAARRRLFHALEQAGVPVASGP